MVTEETTIVPSGPVKDFATRINAEHEVAVSAALDAVAHALEAGRLLSEAKATLPHGAFVDWIRNNCAFSVRTAQAYMRLGRRLPGENAQRVAHLTLRKAFQLVAAPKQLQHEEAQDSEEEFRAAQAELGILAAALDSGNLSLEQLVVVRDRAAAILTDVTKRMLWIERKVDVILSDSKLPPALRVFFEGIWHGQVPLGMLDEFIAHVDAILAQKGEAHGT